jgi:hypothetical protein
VPSTQRKKAKYTDKKAIKAPRAKRHGGNCGDKGYSQ